MLLLNSTERLHYNNNQNRISPFLLLKPRSFFVNFYLSLRCSISYCAVFQFFSVKIKCSEWLRRLPLTVYTSSKGESLVIRVAYGINLASHIIHKCKRKQITSNFEKLTPKWRSCPKKVCRNLSGKFSSLISNKEETCYNTIC